MHAKTQLLEFLASVRDLADAEHAAMFLHIEPLERESTTLVTLPGAMATPELADESRAWEFVSSRNGGLENQAVTILPSTDAECDILRVPVGSVLLRPKATRRAVNERRREPDVTTAPPCDGAIWVGLRRAGRLQEIVDSLRRDATHGGRDHASPASLIGVCFRTIWSAYHYASLLRDPISRLPGRTEQRLFLKRAIAAARRSAQPIGLMLVNPDDFTMVNHRYGRQCGDEAIRQIAQRLQGCLRGTDGVFHYGGAVFAAVLPATQMDECRIAVEKVHRHLTAGRYADGTAALTFSIGATLASSTDLAERDDLELAMTQRADAALNAARLSGGARTVITDLEGGGAAAALTSPLSGVFAADTEKDYRNMLLLWESIALISSHTEPAAIAAAFLDRLAIAFRPDRSALFRIVDQDIEIMASSVRDESAPEGRASGRPLELDTALRELVREAIETRRVARTRTTDGKSAGFSAYAVPLVAGESTDGCLYLDAHGGRMPLDSSDVVFLNALAAQMAVAMDRARLAARWVRQKDRESRMLREELRGLRQALHQTRLVYQSEAMHAVMETLRRVAPSDATVLIVGESGTGKEMLAQSLHELSDRREKSFVVFDCGAVAHNLLEAELFGHTKGAFTGAESASEGRIAQAQGGTLFLDEIGELPLQVQAKLLRFVQEKQYTPVGCSTTRQVDVRIVAATNRDLQREVGGGRFRADLYYRLRVISVIAVPLRDRADDILPLARFFLEKFATQYGRPTIRFGDGAERKLLDYHWPGNVRELQNCVLRAVLTNDDDVLRSEAIEVFPESRLADSAPPVAVATATRSAPATGADEPGEDTAAADPWRALRDELDRQIAAALEHDRRRPAPVGRWLNDDLVLAADDLCDNVARRAAQLVGVAESTFRRQLQKAGAATFTGADYRQDEWLPMRPLIRRLLAQHTTESALNDNVLERARDVLLDRVRAETNVRPSAGASLMGVTLPTYKRWLSARERLT